MINVCFVLKNELNVFNLFTELKAVGEANN
jgi:hypothetical protein